MCVTIWLAPFFCASSAVLSFDPSSTTMITDFSFISVGIRVSNVGKVTDSLYAGMTMASGPLDSLLGPVGVNNTCPTEFSGGLTPK